MRRSPPIATWLGVLAMSMGLTPVLSHGQDPRFPPYPGIPGGYNPSAGSYSGIPGGYGQPSVPYPNQPGVYGQPSNPYPGLPGGYGPSAIPAPYPDPGGAGPYGPPSASYPGYPGGPGSPFPPPPSGPYSGSSPGSAQAVALADQLIAQADAFLRAFTPTARIVPEGGQFIADTVALRNAAGQFRQAAAAGAPPAVLAASFQGVQAGWQRLNARMYRVSKGRMGPNIATALQMGRTIDQIRGSF